MKAKPFRRAVVPDLRGVDPAGALQRKELVALLAANVPRGSADDEATVRNRLSAKVSYDIKHDKLHCVGKGRIRLDEIRRYARAYWPGLLETLPLPHLVISEHVSDKLRGSDAIQGVSLPGTLARCHQQIRSMADRILYLEKELSAERERTRVLSAKAAKLDDWNARKGHSKRQG